ncbi:MAG: ATP-binding protein [Pseudomonadota bacterium]
MSDPWIPLLERANRIATALDRLAPPPPKPLLPEDLTKADAFVWQPQTQSLRPVPQIASLSLALLLGIEQQRDTLLANTKQFAQGYAANNALLWGARGTGKSSLVKAVHQAVNEADDLAYGPLVLIEIHREDLAALPDLLHLIRPQPRRFLIYCDDLSFDKNESSYKSLKAILEGGIEGRPDHVLFYATSNRRHLMPRDMIENEASSAINPGEAVDESVSLSDRFGLWLGFHNCDQPTYRAMVQNYATTYDLDPDDADLIPAAEAWSVTRGARSGRVAWQFIQQRAGALGKSL